MVTQIKVENQSSPQEITVNRRAVAAGVAGAGLALAAALTVGGGENNPKPVVEQPVVCEDSADTHKFKFTSGKGVDDAIADIGSTTYQGNFMNNPCYEENREEVAEQLGVDAAQLEDIDISQGTVINLANYSDPK